MSKKKIIAILSSVIVLSGGGVVVQQKTVETKRAAEIKTVTAVRGDFVKTVGSSGKTKAARHVDLKFQTSGKLAWVNVKEGDTVFAYQAIAGLDPREVQKNLDKALRDYSSERNDFEEAWRVTYTGHSPQNALTDTVKRILEKNQWDLEKAVLDVELKNLSLEFSTLVTPIAGVVTHIDTPVAGVNVTPATAVFTVVDPASMVFEVNADETDVGSLALGQKAQILLDAYPTATFSGTVSYISYASEVSAGGATVFPVQVTFDQPQDVRIGLNGDVTIHSASISDALTVPLEAIREEDGNKFVYKKVGKQYIKTAVQTGMQNDSHVIIEQGVGDGDIVVTKGFNDIPKS